MNKMTILRLAFLVCFSFTVVCCGGDGNNNQADTDTDNPQEQVDEPETNVAVAITYEYDDLNRVTKAVYSNGKTVIYVYDSSGNITEKTVE